MLNLRTVNGRRNHGHGFLIQEQSEGNTPRGIQVYCSGLSGEIQDLKLEGTETGKTFAAYLSSYFYPWLETGMTKKTFESLNDRIVSEQFLKNCHTKLSVFIEDSNCEKLDDSATTTD